jgi:hypothetical protein
MAGRGVPEAVLRQALVRETLDRVKRPKIDIFEEFHKKAPIRKRILEQDTWKKSDEDYTTDGWKRNDFDYKETFDKWVEEHLSFSQYEISKEMILERGQWATARVRDNNGFMRIDLDPLPGYWWDFKKQEILDEWKKDDYRFHISLTRTKHMKEDHPELFQRVKDRWNDRLVNIKISKVAPSGNLILDTRYGIGADPNVQRIYATGSYADKLKENNYGLHISM